MTTTPIYALTLQVDAVANLFLNLGLFAGMGAGKSNTLTVYNKVTALRKKIAVDKQDNIALKDVVDTIGFFMKLKD